MGRGRKARKGEGPTEEGIAEGRDSEGEELSRAGRSRRLVPGKREFSPRLGDGLVLEYLRFELNHAAMIADRSGGNQ